MSASAISVRFPETRASLFSSWSSRHSYLLLAVLTLLCLLPFVGRAFNIDDPLFVWAAQQIQKHPLDPYGFQVVWDNYAEPMSEITKNPPLACYYAALIGSIAGWSEWALHLGFLLPALALVLGTYRLASRFTQSPLLAAAATFLTPGVMVSAASVMCDTMMLAFWIWATVFWVKGLDQNKFIYLATSSLLLALAALTKYFGICLVPLLVMYSLSKKRRLGWWMFYFAVPVLLLSGYQLWTAILYGHRMFSEAFDFAREQREVNGKISFLTGLVIGTSFAGGCTFSAMVLVPLVWHWKKVTTALVIGGLASVALVHGRIGLGPYAEVIVREGLRAHPLTTGIQLMFAIAGGIAVLTLGVTELRHWREANSLLLGLWMLGTFTFTAFVNWTINARSIVPLIPAAGIVLARRLDLLRIDSLLQLRTRVVLALALSGAMSFWAVKADSDWANSAKAAAKIIHQQALNQPGLVWFQGHWGFQYYMQLLGARPVDFLQSQMNRGDVLVVPENNADGYRLIAPQLVASTSLLEMTLPQPLSTMRWSDGAAFYSSFYGPLPFAFGPAHADRYYLFRLSVPVARKIVHRPFADAAQRENPH